MQTQLKARTQGHVGTRISDMPALTRQDRVLRAGKGPLVRASCSLNQPP